MRDFRPEDIDNKNLVTRDGRQVRIICKDRLYNKYTAPVIALVKGHKGRYEQVIQYHPNGQEVNYNTDYTLFVNE